MIVQWQNVIFNHFNDKNIVISIIKLNLFINIWFAIRKLNKYILYAEGLSKAMQATQSVNEMKCTNKKMTWYDMIWCLLGHSYLQRALA